MLLLIDRLLDLLISVGSLLKVLGFKDHDKEEEREWEKEGELAGLPYLFIINNVFTDSECFEQEDGSLLHFSVVGVQREFQVVHSGFTGVI